MITSKYSRANLKSCASTRTGMTCDSTPASTISGHVSGRSHMSAATTSTPNSLARKIELIAQPQPRSSTRMPGARSSRSVSDSASHKGLGPSAYRPCQTGSYDAERGN
jgi:hypothetical protein